MAPRVPTVVLFNPEDVGIHALDDRGGVPDRQLRVRHGDIDVDMGVGLVQSPDIALDFIDRVHRFSPLHRNAAA